MPLDYSEVLVTGGAGFIGSHIVDRLLDKGLKVRVLDNLSTGEKKNTTQHKNNKNFQFTEGDIRNFDQVKKAVKGVDAVVHEAALVSVPLSVESPLLSREINVKGTLNLLKACVDEHVKRFVFASSCAVYGNTQTLPIHENLVPKPLSPYATDKLAAESYTQRFHEIYELETVCLRYFNVYGPRQKIGQYSGVIPIFIKSYLNNKAPTIYGIGEQKRDFVNVRDVVEANIQALTKQQAIREIFNVGTGKPTTINRLSAIIQNITDKTSIKPVYAESRPGEIKYSYGDITKIQKLLGYKPGVSLEDGLKELVEWSSNH